MKTIKRLKPWVKITLLFVIGVIIASQIFKIIDTDATSETEEKKFTREALHGLVELTMDGKAFLTIIEEEVGVGEVEVPNQNYSNGDIVTVIYDNEGNITNSFLSSDREIESLRNQFGVKYRMLLEKHGLWFSTE